MVVAAHSTFSAPFSNEIVFLFGVLTQVRVGLLCLAQLSNVWSQQIPSSFDDCNNIDTFGGKDSWEEDMIYD